MRTLNCFCDKISIRHTENVILHLRLEQHFQIWGPRDSRLPADMALLNGPVKMPFSLRPKVKPLWKPVLRIASHNKDTQSLRIKQIGKVQTLRADYPQYI